MYVVKAVAFQYEPNEAVGSLLQSFRMMVDDALWVGTRRRIRGRFKLIRVVHNDFKRYGLHTHYTLSACEVASAILKNHRRNHRTPIARKLYLKLDNQTYKLSGDVLRIPIKPRQFFTLKLNVGGYQRVFLEDPTLKHGSITLTETKVIMAFEKVPATYEPRAVTAYDTNELSLDGAFSNGHRIRPIHVDLKKIARIRAIHFERRRRSQSRLAHCQRRLKAKLREDRNLERRRVDAILHQVARTQVQLARQKHSKIVLEDLRGIRRSINRRVRKRNRYNGKIQPVSVHSKAFKRRLNSWPFRRLHSFIEYKARWDGVPLSYVPAKNTSRTCSMCGCLQPERDGVQDPKTLQAFTCRTCGWRCNRHLNAALNLLRTQDEGRWFSPDRFPNEVMTVKRAYGEEVNLSYFPIS